MKSEQNQIDNEAVEGSSEEYQDFDDEDEKMKKENNSESIQSEQEDDENDEEDVDQSDEENDQNDSENEQDDDEDEQIDEKQEKLIKKTKIAKNMDYKSESENEEPPEDHSGCEQPVEIDEMADYNLYLEKMEKEMEEDANKADYEERELEENQKDPQESKLNHKNKSNLNNQEDEVEDPEELFQNLAYGVSSKNIERVENALLNKKSWQLQGEVRASQRPLNGLLDAEVDFDLGLQSKIVISKELNQKYEDVIKQRITDMAFDDRELPKQQKFNIKDQSKQYEDLNFEKDNRGLTGVFEDEYRKTVLGSDPVKTKQDKMKEQILSLYKNICFCIDSMSRNNFTPNNILLSKSKTPESQILVDEKIPVFVSTNMVENRKAFREIHDAGTETLKTRAEMDSKQKKGLDRKLKEARHKISLRIKEQNRLKSGISFKDSKLLEKNKSKVTKQISDSKVERRPEVKGSNFFETLEKLKKIKEK